MVTEKLDEAADDEDLPDGVDLPKEIYEESGSSESKKTISENDEAE